MICKTCTRLVAGRCQYLDLPVGNLDPSCRQYDGVIYEEQDMPDERDDAFQYDDDDEYDDIDDDDDDDDDNWCDWDDDDDEYDDEEVEHADTCD